MVGPQNLMPKKPGIICVTSPRRRDSGMCVGGHSDGIDMVAGWGMFLNLNAEMLHSGMASVISIPPNLWGQDCYRQQEHQARHAAKGIWGPHGIKIWQVGDVPRSLRGFQFIQGKVKNIITTRKSIWLEFSPRLSVRIARDDIPYFNRQRLYNLLNRKLEVRGWLNFYKGRLHVRIRQPAAMRIIN